MKTLKPRDWTKLSAGERSVTYGGRHFFASRYGRRFYWTLEEMDQASWSGAKTLKVHHNGILTRDLCAAVMDITKETTAS